MNNKILLVLDNSNLMFRSLFMNSLYGPKVNYERQEDMRSFIYKFATDICSIVNIFRPNNVVMATDAQNAWRKDILPGDDGYKSNRQKNAEYNWDNIFSASDDLLRILNSRGVHIAQCERAEADDVVAMFKEQVFRKYPDYNIIIVSADADLRQLIDFNEETHQYCAVYNTITHGKTSKRHFFVTQGLIDWLNKTDELELFFSNADPGKTYLKDLLNNNPNIELTLENPTGILLNKIFCGDDGDAVPSFYDWVKDGKYTRVTPAKAKKIMETCGISSIGDVVRSADGIKEVLEKIAKKEVNDIDVADRIGRQRLLVELNSSLFPEHIQEYRDTIDYMVENPWTYNPASMKAPALLEGTAYQNANKPKALTADVFRDVDKYLGSMPGIKLF